MRVGEFGWDPFFPRYLQALGALSSQWCGSGSAFRFARAGAGSAFAWGGLVRVLDWGFVGACWCGMLQVLVLDLSSQTIGHWDIL